MKKNILAIAILAAVIANIILSTIILFSIVPAANSASRLIEKVVKVINLELENPDASSYAKVPLASRKPFGPDKELTVSLKKGEGEAKSTYALIDYKIILNADASNYKEVTAIIADQYPVLNDYIMALVKAYTKSEVNLHEDQIRAQMLSYCRTYFRPSDTSASDELVVDVTLNITVQ